MKHCKDQHDVIEKGVDDRMKAIRDLYEVTTDIRISIAAISVKLGIVSQQRGKRGERGVPGPTGETGEKGEHG